MKKLFLTILILFVGTMTVCATELPLNIQSRLKKEISGVNIRFDGLVEYPDGTQYLPVFPMDLKKGTIGNVAKTYPSGKALRDEPAMVLFDNNFAMLKILKRQNHNPTVIFYPEMPLCIKRGLLPQDLLVPENLVLPEELEILLGNLFIPLEKLSNEFDYYKELDRGLSPTLAKQVQKQNPLPSSVSAFGKAYPCLANKMLYTVNYQSNCVYIINPENGKISKTIPLRSTPSDFIMTRNQRYLLVATLGTSNLAVVDLDTGLVVKEIDSGLLPRSLVVDNIKNIVYVANQNSSNISIIDLDNMDLVEKFEVKGKPSRLAVSSDRKKLFYLDCDTDTVYEVVLYDDIKEINELFKTRNLSKLINVNDKLYLTCRDKDNLVILDGKTNKPIKKIEVGQKPIDIAISGSKLYVVSAVADSLSVIDLNKDEKINEIPLATKNFPNKINLFDNSNMAIISTASAHEYILVDLRRDCVVKKLPTDIIISKVIVSKRH